MKEPKISPLILPGFNDEQTLSLKQQGEFLCPKEGDGLTDEFMPISKKDKVIGILKKVGLGLVVALILGMAIYFISVPGAYKMFK